MKTMYSGVMVHRPHRARYRLIALLITLVSIIPIAFVGISSTTPDSHADLVQYLMCSWDSDDGKSPALVKSMYEIATTDDLQRQINYKSQAGADTDTVSNLPNLISGKDYDKVQLDILNTGNATKTTYTPYDRFGFSGMNFTDYNGEWNWYKVYYCRANGKGYGDTKDPEDGHLNEYYKERKGHRPMDTYDGIKSSKDPRAERKAQALASFGNNWNLNISNFLFTITKVLTSLVGMTMELTLTDMSSKLGVTGFISGNGSTTGLYNLLFKNLFMQMISIMMVITALVMLIRFIKHNKFRESLSSSFSALGCLFVGLIMMVNPAIFINLPNTIGMIGQGLMLSGISSVTNDNSTGFCNTSSGSKKNDVINIELTGNLQQDGNNIAKQLDDSGSATRRNLECEYYVIFALQPYALGQYGANYTDLWAEGHAQSGGGTLGNTMSSSYTGNAPVPLGNNKVMYNWMIYQISTQTNRHIDSSTVNQTNGKMTKPDKGKEFTSASQYESQLTKADGTNTDWWRVVDAMANYKTDSNGNPDKSTANKPVEYWNTWVGGNNMQRLLVVILSLFFAIVGLAAPIAIGLSVIAYAIGSVLIMGFAPVALTFGMWAGHGQRILKGWLQLLGTMVLKRIVMGFIFMLLTVFMIKIAAGITNVAGYFQSMVLISIVSYALARNRKIIANMLGRVHIGGAMNLTKGAEGGAGSLMKTGRAGVQSIGGGIVGGIAGVKQRVGGNNPVKGFTKGAARSMKTTIAHSAYQTQAGREYAEATRKMDSARNRPSRENVYCDRCGRLITGAGEVMEEGRDYNTTNDGRVLCNECATITQMNK